MKKVWNWLKTPKGRRFVYKSVGAVGAGLVAYGVVDNNTVAIVVAEVGSLLGVTVAHVNVPKDQ